VTPPHNRQTRVGMSLREAVVTGRQRLLTLGGTGNVARSRAFLVTGPPSPPRVSDTADHDASYRRHRGGSNGRRGLSHGHGDGGGAPVLWKRCTANSVATKRQSHKGAHRRRHCRRRRRAPNAVAVSGAAQVPTCCRRLRRSRSRRSHASLVVSLPPPRRLGQHRSSSPVRRRPPAAVDRPWLAGAWL